MTNWSSLFRLHDNLDFLHTTLTYSRFRMLLACTHRENTVRLAITITINLKLQQPDYWRDDRLGLLLATTEWGNQGVWAIFPTQYCASCNMTKKKMNQKKIKIQFYKKKKNKNLHKQYLQEFGRLHIHRWVNATFTPPQTFCVVTV